MRSGRPTRGIAERRAREHVVDAVSDSRERCRFGVPLRPRIPDWPARVRLTLTAFVVASCIGCRHTDTIVQTAPRSESGRATEVGQADVAPAPPTLSADAVVDDLLARIEADDELPQPVLALRGAWSGPAEPFIEAVVARLDRQTRWYVVDAMLRALMRCGPSGIEAARAWRPGATLRTSEDPWAAAVELEVLSGPPSARAALLDEWIEMGLAPQLDPRGVRSVHLEWLALLPERLQDRVVARLTAVLLDSSGSPYRRGMALQALSTVVGRTDVLHVLLDVARTDADDEIAGAAASGLYSWCTGTMTWEGAWRSSPDVAHRALVAMMTSRRPRVRSLGRGFAADLASIDLRAFANVMPSTSLLRREATVLDAFPWIDCGQSAASFDDIEELCTTAGRPRYGALWSLGVCRWDEPFESAARALVIDLAAHPAADHDDIPIVIAAARRGVSLDEIAAVTPADDGRSVRHRAMLRSLLLDGAELREHVLDCLRSHDMERRYAGAVGLSRIAAPSEELVRKVRAAWADGADAAGGVPADDFELDFWAGALAGVGGVSVRELAQACTGGSTENECLVDALPALARVRGRAAVVDELLDVAVDPDDAMSTWALGRLEVLYAADPAFTSTIAPVLVRVLTGDGDASHVAACRAAERLPVLPPELRAALPDELADADADVAVQAARALARSPETAEVAVDVALEVLAREEKRDAWERRQAAAEVLANASPNVALDIDRLLELARHATVYEGAWTTLPLVIALGAQRERAAPAVPFLAERTRWGSTSGRWGNHWGSIGEGNILAAAARALGRVPVPAARDALLLVVEGEPIGEMSAESFFDLDGADVFARLEGRVAAIRALAHHADDTDGSIAAALEHAARSHYPEVAAAARETLAAFGE